MNKLPAIEGGSKGCLNCGPMLTLFSMDALIAIGFGGACVTKNDELVYSEQVAEYDKTELWIGQDAENAALEDPDADWRILIDGPLYSAHYQRQDVGQWVLYYKDLGFA